MSQRVSGYERKENEAYFTPPWVTLTLLDHIRVKPPAKVFEPAAGGGKIVDALVNVGFKVASSDLTDGQDFLGRKRVKADAIITNPPYKLAHEFIEHSIRLMAPNGLVAMLLRTDFDHAATRRHLFGIPFAQRIVLCKRIRWFENSTGSPSFNHCWFVWDWQHRGLPTIAYGP